MFCYPTPLHQSTRFKLLDHNVYFIQTSINSYHVVEIHQKTTLGFSDSIIPTQAQKIHREHPKTETHEIKIQQNQLHTQK